MPAIDTLTVTAEGSILLVRSPSSSFYHNKWRSVLLAT